MAFSFSVLGNSPSLKWKIKLADRCRWCGSKSIRASFREYRLFCAMVFDKVYLRPFNTSNKCWLRWTRIGLCRFGTVRYGMVCFGSLRFGLAWFGLASFRLSLFANYIHSNCLLCLCVTIYLIDFLPNGKFCLCAPYTILLCIFGAPPCCLRYFCCWRCSWCLFFLLYSYYCWCWCWWWCFCFCFWLLLLLPLPLPGIISFHRTHTQQIHRVWLEWITDKSILKAHLSFTKHISKCITSRATSNGRLEKIIQMHSRFSFSIAPHQHQHQHQHVNAHQTNTNAW